MLSKKQKETFGEFWKSTHFNDLLDAKATVMIQLASAMALGCYPGMRDLSEAAKKEGMTKEEIGAVRAIVMAVSAAKVNRQYKDACS
ncbi:MAG: carboxymuconolactone decarboxylase family protein [Proteobacteria bacterium]|nr:carboxymuconolactone decarboxylase family protein [Pseudomonadota bacterium]